MSDVHLIPDLLQARAKELGLCITVQDESEQEEGADFGPFILSCAETGYHIWWHGLPAGAFADALNCFESELLLSDEAIGKAWRDFGFAVALRGESPDERKRDILSE